MVTLENTLSHPNYAVTMKVDTEQTGSLAVLRRDSGALVCNFSYDPFCVCIKRADPKDQKELDLILDWAATLAKGTHSRYVYFPAKQEDKKSARIAQEKGYSSIGDGYRRLSMK